MTLYIQYHTGNIIF